MTIARVLPRFRKAMRALDELAGREQWTRGEIESWQLERLNGVWRHAREHVPWYRELAIRLSLPEQFDSLDEYKASVPTLSKDQLREHHDDFLSRLPSAGGWHRTGGSTGVPLAIYWGGDAHREMLWRKYRMEQAWGLDLFDRKAFLWGHAASFAPGARGALQRASQRWVDRLRNRERFNAYQLGVDDLQRYAERLRRGRFKSLYGYSSAVTLLAEQAAAQGIALPEFKLAILTAEPAHDDMLARCRAGLGGGAAIEYGSVDCGVIATGMPDRTLRVCEDMVYLETVPRADDRFDLVVTVLNNPSFPLLRFAIEDLADQPLDRGDQGFACLVGVSGRANDSLVTCSGRRVHPLVVKHAFEGFDGIRRFQAHQSRDGSVAVRIESPHGIDRRQAAAAAARLSEILEGQPVETEVTSRLLGNRAGKHRWVTSEVEDLEMAEP